MHSTIFVLNDNPISKNDVIDDDYFSVILYLNYELDKPLIPQVKENGKLAGKMLAMVEDMVSRVQ